MAQETPEGLTKPADPAVLRSWYQRGMAVRRRGNAPDSVSAYFQSPSIISHSGRNHGDEAAYFAGLYNGQNPAPEATPAAPVFSLPQAAAVQREAPSTRQPVQVPVQATTASKIDELSFKQVFASARRMGLSEFTWRGNAFNTRLKSDPATRVAATPSLDPVMSDEEAAASVNDDDPVAAQPTPTAVLPMQGGMPEQQRPMAVGYGGVNSMGMNREQQLLQRFLANRARQQQSRNQSIVGEP